MFVVGLVTGLVGLGSAATMMTKRAAKKAENPLVLAAIIETAKGVAGVSNVIVTSVLVNGVAADLIALPQQVPRCVGGVGDIAVSVAGLTAYS